MKLSPYFAENIPELVDDELAGIPQDADHCTQRVEVADARTLGALERALTAKAEATMKGSAIASLSPTFRGWIVAGYWPRPTDPGFTVLLRLAVFSGNMPGAAMGLGGRGR